MSKIAVMSKYRHKHWEEPELGFSPAPENIDYDKPVAGGGTTPSTVNNEVPLIRAKIDGFCQGHQIKDEDGEEYQERKYLHIENTTVVDNATTNTTIITFNPPDKYFYSDLSVAKAVAASGSMAPGALVFLPVVATGF